MRTYKRLVLPMLAVLSIVGCGNKFEDVYIPEETVIDETMTSTTDVTTDNTTVSDTVVGAEVGDTGIDTTVTDTEVIEDESKFAEYDMLEVTVDEIPFTLGNTFEDFKSNFSIIGYRLSANTKGRNLSSGQSLEVPIVSKDDRTIGYLTISNSDDKKHAMRTSPVTELTIIPDAVLSVEACGINQSSTYEDTLFSLGEPTTSEITSILYESDIGKLYCTYTANGDLTGITVILKEVK